MSGNDGAEPALPQLADHGEPVVEVSLGDEQVQVVVDQVLGDEHVLIG